jgi:hypothetical protein
MNPNQEIDDQRFRVECAQRDLDRARQMVRLAEEDHQHAAERLTDAEEILERLLDKARTTG